MDMGNRSLPAPPQDWGPGSERLRVLTGYDGGPIAWLCVSHQGQTQWIQAGQHQLELGGVLPILGLVYLKQLARGRVVIDCA